MTNVKDDSDLKKLEGMWGLRRAEHNGREFPAAGFIIFGQNGDYVMIWNLHHLEHGTDLLNSAATPKEIDVVIKQSIDIVTNGPGRDESSMTGIYKIEDDIFTACYGRKFKVRPKTFTSNKRGFMYIWKRLPDMALARPFDRDEIAAAPSSAHPTRLPSNSSVSRMDHISPRMRQLLREIRDEEPIISASFDNGACAPIPRNLSISLRTQSILEEHREIVLTLPDWLVALLPKSVL